MKIFYKMSLLLLLFQPGFAWSGEPHEWFRELKRDNYPESYRPWIRWENCDEQETAHITVSEKQDYLWVVKPREERGPLTKNISMSRSGLHSYFYDIESQLPEGSVYPKDEVSFDTLEHKAGIRSAKWNWKPGSQMDIPISTPLIAGNERYVCFWMYNEVPQNTYCTAYLRIDSPTKRFKSGDHLKAYVWLDFRGWRRVTFILHRYHLATEEGEQADQARNTLRIIAPADAKNFVCLDRITHFEHQQEGEHIDCFMSLSPDGYKVWDDKESVRGRIGAIRVPDELPSTPGVVPPKLRLVPGTLPVIEDREMTLEEEKAYAVLQERFGALRDTAGTADDPEEEQRRSEAFVKDFGWIFTWRDPDGKVRGPNLNQELYNIYFAHRAKEEGSRGGREEHLKQHYAGLRKGDIICPIRVFAMPIINAHNEAPCATSLDAMRILWHWITYHSFAAGQEANNNRYSRTNGFCGLIGSSLAAIRQIDEQDGSNLEEELINASFFIARAPFHFAENYAQKTPGAWKPHAEKWRAYPSMISNLLPSGKRSLNAMLALHMYFRPYMAVSNCSRVGHKPDYTALHHNHYGSYWGSQDMEQSKPIFELRGTPWGMDAVSYNTSVRNMIQRSRSRQANNAEGVGARGNFKGQRPTDVVIPRMFYNVGKVVERIIEPGIEEGRWIPWYFASCINSEKSFLGTKHESKFFEDRMIGQINPNYVKAVPPLERYNMAFHSHGKTFHAYGFANLNINGRKSNYGPHEVRNQGARGFSNRYSGSLNVADRYSDVVPGFFHRGYNWSRVPGATSYDLPTEEKPIDLLLEDLGVANYYQDHVNCEAYQVSQHHNGVFGMIQDSKSGLRYKVSRFMFDETVVCLGSDIDPSKKLPGTPIVSTLFQSNTSHGFNATDPRRWTNNPQNPKAYIDKVEHTFPVQPTRLSLDQPHTIINPHGFAYFIPKQQARADFKVQWVSQKSCGSTMSAPGGQWNGGEGVYMKEISEAEAMISYFDHGEDPAGDHYEFALVLGDGTHKDNQAFVDFVESYKTKSPYTVLQHNDDRHSVAYRKGDLKLNGVMMFNEDSRSEDAPYVIETNRKLGMLIKELGERTILFSASDGELMDSTTHPDSPWGFDESSAPERAYGSPLRKTVVKLKGAYVVKSAHPVDRGAGGAVTEVLEDGNTELSFVTRDGHTDTFVLERVTNAATIAQLQKQKHVAIHQQAGLKTAPFENPFQRDVILTFGRCELKPPAEDGAWKLPGAVAKYFTIHPSSGELTRNSREAFPAEGLSFDASINTPEGVRAATFTVPAQNQAPVITSKLPETLNIAPSVEPKKLFTLEGKDPEGAQVQVILFNSTDVVDHFAIKGNDLYLTKSLAPGQEYKLRLRFADQGDPHVTDRHNMNSFPAYVDHYLIVNAKEE